MTTFTFRPADDEGEHSQSEAPPNMRMWLCIICRRQTFTVPGEGTPVCGACNVEMTCGTMPDAPTPDDAALAEARRWDALRSAAGAYIAIHRRIEELTAALADATRPQEVAAKALYRALADAGAVWPLLLGDVILDAAKAYTLTVRTVRRL